MILLYNSVIAFLFFLVLNSSCNCFFLFCSEMYIFVWKLDAFNSYVLGKIVKLLKLLYGIFFLGKYALNINTYINGHIPAVDGGISQCMFYSTVCFVIFFIKYLPLNMGTKNKIIVNFMAFSSFRI